MIVTFRGVELLIIGEYRVGVSEMKIIIHFIFHSLCAFLCDAINTALKLTELENNCMEV